MDREISKAMMCPVVVKATETQGGSRGREASLSRDASAETRSRCQSRAGCPWKVFQAEGLAQAKALRWGVICFVVVGRRQYWDLNPEPHTW